MTPHEIAERLANEAESVCRYLFANGRVVRGEFCLGSIAGDEGESLKVRLTGAKSGVWRDFADSEKGGDLLDLWMRSRRLTMPETLRQAKEYLGIKDEREAFYPASTKAKPVSMPAKAHTPGDKSPVRAWLNQRGIPDATIDAYKVHEEGGVAVFPCYHEGDLMLCKFRDISEKKIWASKDATPVLFGWQAINPAARDVVITEGEIDAMTYHANGYDALSVPFGAGKGAKQAWIEHEIDRLERFDTLYISTDMDKEGEIAAQEIMERLGRHRCKRVILPAKDANEYHVAGGNLVKCVMEAKSIDPAELREAVSFTDEVIEQFFPTSTKASGTPVPWYQLRENLRLRPGELTIVTGINGHGKTMLLDHVSVHGMANESRWCIASMEMPAPVHLKRIVKQISGPRQPFEESGVRAAMDWMAGKCWIFNVRGTAKAARIIEVFTYAWRRYGIHHFVVDSLAKCGFAEDDYNGQKGFVERLQDFAQDSHTHVFLVTHSRKREDEYAPPGKMDVKGSGGITDMADNVLSIWRNKKKEDLIQMGGADRIDPKDNYDALLIVSKQRNHGWEGKLTLTYNQGCDQYIDKVGRLVNYMEYVP